MPKIKLLSEEIINKIAAGEVIERPASVVKELLENSIDAKATRIIIDLKDSGKELIRIRDNGEGMDQIDARNSILRHATSKLKQEEDLYSITTLGFRGEALASIAAVSNLSIITKQEKDLEGFHLDISAGEVVSSSQAAADTGTTIEVRNLFFNTPARKKFLKTDAVELKHIVDAVIGYALIHPQIFFKLTHEGYELLNSPVVGKAIDRIASIYGINLAKELLEINYPEKSVLVKGFVAKPHEARNDKAKQIIFVNYRKVRNEDISKAVYDAFHSTLYLNKHPIFILNLDLDPKEIDVNVHPQKTEIKISQKEIVYQAVYNAVRKVLEENNLIPPLNFPEEDWKEKPVQTTIKKNRFSEDKHMQTVLEVKEDETKKPIAADELDSENKINTLPQNEFKSAALLNNNNNLKIPPMRILGQVHKTFFIGETADGLMLIDQHVVQERIYYEQFMQQYMGRKVAVQNLLQGHILEFSAPERVILEENKEKLSALGFRIEHFGGNNYLLKTAPTIFGRLQPKEILYEILHTLEEKRNSIDRIQEEIITRMSCRASIKAGDEVTISYMERLLEELSGCELPYTCPHGRAILIKITIDELEKKFKRK